MTQNNDSSSMQTPSPMEISVRFQKGPPSGSTLAHASVTINGCFAIRDIKVMQGKNGPFISMPSRKVGQDYRDICFPCTKEFKQQFDQAVLTAYQQTQAQAQSSQQ